MSMQEENLLEAVKILLKALRQDLPEGAPEPFAGLNDDSTVEDLRVRANVYQYMGRAMAEAARPDTQVLRAQALAYLQGSMSDEERTFFEQMMAESESLRQEVSQSRAVITAVVQANGDGTTDLVNDLLRAALDAEVTDLHIEPEKNRVRVRMRVDGVLHEREPLPRSTQQAVVDRVKTMAEMNLAERQRSQVGRIPVKHNTRDYEVRVSIFPSLYGEKIVARFLSPDSLLPGLDHLNLWPQQVETLRRLAQIPSGLFIASGAAGTGKTTLLYSLLQTLQSDTKRSVATVEYPVEMALGSGIVQTAVDPAAQMTFPALMRTLLRSDADVVYCADTRDSETAGLCVEAAQRGQAVFTVLRTTSPVQAIARLRDLGISSFDLADTLTVLTGHQLLRRTDDRQLEEYEPDANALARLGLTHADGPFQRGVPSEANHQTGFRGRLPLLEIVEVEESFRRAIASGANPAALWKQAFANGGSLLDDARAKIRAGLTTVEEADRALLGYGVPEQ